MNCATSVAKRGNEAVHAQSQDKSTVTFGPSTHDWRQNPTPADPTKVYYYGSKILRIFTPLIRLFTPLSPIPATVYYFWGYFSIGKNFVLMVLSRVGFWN